MTIDISLLNEQFARSLYSDCNGSKINIKNDASNYYIDMSNINDSYAESLIFFLEEITGSVKYHPSDFYKYTINLYNICFNNDQSIQKPTDFPIEKVRHALILAELIYRFIEYFCSDRYAYILKNKYDLQNVLYIQTFYNNMKSYLINLSCNQDTYTNSDIVYNIAFVLLQFNNILPLNVACIKCQNIIFCIDCIKCVDCEVCFGCYLCSKCYNNMYCAHNINCEDAIKSYKNYTSSNIYYCYLSENLKNCQYCFVSSNSTNCCDLYRNMKYFLSTPTFRNHRCEKCKVKSYRTDKFRVTIKRKSPPVVYIFCKKCMLDELGLIRDDFVNQYYTI